MPHLPAFGRRDLDHAAPARGKAAPTRDAPSPRDLNSAKADDLAELREFKRGFRHRRFAGRGGWRWIAGLAFALSSITGLLGYDILSWGMLAASVIAFVRSFKRPPLDATDEI